MYIIRYVSVCRKVTSNTIRWSLQIRDVYDYYSFVWCALNRLCKYHRICLQTILVFFVKVSQFYVLAPSAMVFSRGVGNTFLSWSFPFYMFLLGKFLAAKRIFWLICLGLWFYKTMRGVKDIVWWGVTRVSSHARLT